MLQFHPLRVVQVTAEAEDAVAVALEPGAARPLFAGRPGQHVVVRHTLDGQEARRTYSPVSAPGEWPLRIIARVHEHGRMSRYLAEGLRAGDTLEVLPPNGSFTPRAAIAGGTFVAFAAGCGITPVLSIVRALLAGDAAAVLLFYGNTGTGRTLCLEELQALKDRYLPRLALHFLMSREPQEVELFNGRLDAARVHELARGWFDPQAVREFFICGPGDMIEQVSAALQELGVEAARMHAEHFRITAASAPAPTPTPVAPPAQDATAAATAEVIVQMDGRRRSFQMERDGETVLEGAARAGLELPFSCRAGVCSTCRTKVLRGEVHMLQNYALEEWELEAGFALACQSQVRSAVLELDYDAK
ncbi:MAG: 2Fe-2S iron-sulfur cluster binding domain-containing protein [Gammaproteobacteria bacterium]|nr:2Fe-2S iron-sulfur cluster binding domain-containing protein [Gammaproteobacteria bacterium]